MRTKRPFPYAEFPRSVEMILCMISRPYNWLLLGYNGCSDALPCGSDHDANGGLTRTMHNVGRAWLQPAGDRHPWSPFALLKAFGIRNRTVPHLMLPRQALCCLGNGTGDVKIISDVLQVHPIPAPRQYEIRQFGLYEEHLRLLSQRSHSEIECDVANGPLTVNLGYRSLASCIERQCTYDRSNDAHRNSIRGVCRKFSFEGQDQAESDLIALLRPNYKRRSRGAHPAP